MKLHAVGCPMAKTQNSLVQEQILQGAMEKRICDFGHDSPSPCQLYAATLHLINTTAIAIKLHALG